MAVGISLYGHGLTHDVEGPTSLPKQGIGVHRWANLDSTGTKSGRVGAPLLPIDPSDGFRNTAAIPLCARPFERDPSKLPHVGPRAHIV
jgi:hypothetical protein